MKVNAYQTGIKGPFGSQYGLPYWPNLNLLYQQITQTPKVTEANFTLTDSDPPGLIMDLYNGEEKIGCISMVVDPDNPDVCVFWGFNLIDEYQRKGMFKVLCKQLLKWLDASHWTKITARHPNEAVTAAVKSIGFHEVHDKETDPYGSDLTDPNSKLHKTIGE